MPEIDLDYGALAQRAAEAHLAACWEALGAAEESDDPDDWPPSPAVAPFCGCDTCVVREVLFVAWDIIEVAVREGNGK